MIDRITEKPFCQTCVSGRNGELNRYVKVQGHTNWFLVLEADNDEPNGLSEIMQEKILRSEVCAVRRSASHKLK